MGSLLLKEPLDSRALAELQATVTPERNADQIARINFHPHFLI